MTDAMAGLLASMATIDALVCIARICLHVLIALCFLYKNTIEQTDPKNRMKDLT